MERSILSFFAILALCASNAQPSFTKYYSTGGAYKLNMHELSSGNIHTAIAAFSGTSVIDQMGNILHTHCYVTDTFRAVQSVKKYAENEFVFTGTYIKDACSVSPSSLRLDPFIGRMDSMGNVYSTVYYTLTAPYCGFVGRGLEITSENDAIAWGEDDFFALRVSVSGAVQWAKWFGRRGGVGFIKELPDGDLLAGFNMDTAGVVVARMDAGGNFLWCKSYIRPGGRVADCAIESDDSFVITGYTDSTTSTNPFEPLPADYHPRLFMMKLNGTGEVQWCKGYDSGAYGWYARMGGQIVETLDGNYAVLGNLGVPGYNVQYRPFLMKTNPNGDTLWTRSAGENGEVYNTRNLLACSDGGFMYTGSGLSTEWGVYLFKTDSLGYLPCHNRHHPVEVVDLFPVDSSFVLSSIDGATAHPAFITDTIRDPLVVSDACFASINTMGRRPQGLRVYPNPNTGRFTVEFQDPLMADSYYSVYDAVGKLLYQRPLRTGATVEEVDLGRYGPGSYVVHFTSTEGTCYERVVVE
jgi:hypothetical protein